MYYYIVNPAAGAAKINKIQDKLQERLKRLGILGEFVKSTGPDDVAKLARLGIERGYKTIVAVGGDGTINEVMNAVLDNEKVVIGIIPTGTTNELADALGIKDWASATNILSARKVEEINLGRVGKRYFVTSVAVGFDPKVADMKRLSKGTLPERLRFAFKLFKQAAAYKPIKAALSFEGDYEVEAECFNVTVTNGCFGDKSDQENNLSTTVVTKIPGSKAFKYGFGAEKNTFELPKISNFHSKKVRIETVKPTDVVADGQRVGETPADIAITDKKIRMIVARKRKS